MPWTVLRPSFRSCQVEPQFSSAYPPDKAWTIPRPAHVRPQSALPIFPLTNLQPHKSALTISPTDGMAASTLRPCFGQLAEACTSCTFDTVTAGLFGIDVRVSKVESLLDMESPNVLIVGIVVHTGPKANTNKTQTSRFTWFPKSGTFTEATDCILLEE